MMASIQIPARDGFPLAASHFPAHPAPHGVVLISPATGVKRSLYRRFAEFLAGRGFTSQSRVPVAFYNVAPNTTTAGRLSGAFQIDVVGRAGVTLQFGRDRELE